jgi:hypothetical protein
MNSDNDFQSAIRTPPACAGVIGNGNRPVQSRAAQFISDREGRRALRPCQRPGAGLRLGMS